MSTKRKCDQNLDPEPSLGDPTDPSPAVHAFFDARRSMGCKMQFLACDRDRAGQPKRARERRANFGRTPSHGAR